MNKPVADVFVSYAHRDANTVLADVERINDAGFSVWIDQGITPGTAWREEIAHAIEQCSLFLFFVSPDSTTSDHCQRELNYALETGKPIICVHLKKATLSAGQKMSLMDRQHIYRFQLTEENYTDNLIAGLRGPHDGSHGRGSLHSDRRFRKTRIASVSIALAALISGWIYLQSSQAPTELDIPSQRGEINSIAVMPFAAVGKASDGTSVGIHTELLSYLSRIPGLAVISIDSLKRIQADDLSTLEVAETLSVNYVVRGTLQHANERFRLNLTMLNGASGRIVWSESYDRMVDDLFVVQADIAQTVADQLAIKLGLDDQAVLSRSPTNNLDAWRLFQSARDGSNSQAIPLLREAISLDPNFHTALAQLALRLHRSNHPNSDEVRAYAQRAADLAPADAETIAILGLSYALEDPLTAENYFNQARSLDPLWGSNIVADTRFWIHADLDGALGEFQRALRLNPLNPAPTHAWAILANRDLAGALRHVDKIERIRPNHLVIVQIQAMVAAAQNDLAKAIEIASNPQLREIDNREPLVLFLNAVGLTEQAAAASRYPPMSESLNHGVVALWRDSGQINKLRRSLPRESSQNRWMHTLVRQYALITKAKGGVTDTMRAQLRSDIEQDDTYMRTRYARYEHIPAWFLRHDLPVEGLIARKLAGMDASLTWLIEALRHALANGGTFESPKREHVLLAVAAALEGDLDEAITQFQQAYKYGLRNLSGLAFFGLIDDPNGIYGGLTEDPRYQSLLTEITQANELTRTILLHRHPHLLEPGFLQQRPKQSKP